MQRAGVLLMLLPYLGGILLLVGLPAVLSLALAFTEYDALAPPIPVAFENFTEMFRDPLFLKAAKNSLVFICLAVPLRVLGALGVALLLNRPRRGVGIYRAGIYLPTVIPDAAYALIWLWILNPIYGPLNVILRAAGLPAPDWLVDPVTAKLGIVLMSAFQIGEGLVVLLAGLKDIPAEYYDAATVEGGTWHHVFGVVTLPMLLPWLMLLTFRDIILSFQNTFTPALVMTGGDPYYATLFMPLLVYEEAFDHFRFGSGSAMMLVMFLLTAILLLVLYLLFRGKWYADAH